MRKARFTVASSTPSPFAVDDNANTASSLLLLSRVKSARRALNMPLVSLVKLLLLLSVQHIFLLSRWTDTIVHSVLILCTTTTERHLVSYQSFGTYRTYRR